MGSQSAAGLNIVLIEDNPSDVDLMQLALEESGLDFKFTKFQNGAEALLTLCPAAGGLCPGPIPDAILLDLNTPRCDGFEVLATIRNHAGLSHVPVAIITSSDSPADQHRAELLGATTFIRKPTQLEAFILDIGGGVRRMLASTHPIASSL